MHLGWVISGSRQKASSRLQGYLIHEALQRQDIRSVIVAADFSRLNEDAQPLQTLRLAAQIRRSGITHLVVVNPEWQAVQVAQIARCWGVIVVCVRCDLYPAAYDRYFDLTIVPTEELRDRLKISKVAVIDDMVDCSPEISKDTYDCNATDGTVSVAWVGHPNYLGFISGFIEALRHDPRCSSGFRFITISKGPEFSHQWSEETVVADILSADIAMLPIPDGDWFSTKSTNRLALMLTLGMPCVASPIKSYVDLVGDSNGAIFAATHEEFVIALQRLRSAAERKRLGVAGRALVGDRFTPDVVAAKWLRALRQVQRSDQKAWPVGLRHRLLAVLVKLWSLLPERANAQVSSQQ